MLNALVSITLLATVLSPDASWVLLGDGQVQTGQEWSFGDNARVNLQSGGDASAQRSIQDPAVLMATGMPTEAGPTGSARVYLRNGEILLGYLAAPEDGNSLNLESARLGTVSLSLDDVLSIHLEMDGHAVPDRSEPPYVLLTNGDVLPGAIGGLTAEAVSVDSAFGAVETDLDRVTRIVFAAAEETQANRPATAWLLEIRDGQRWYVEDLSDTGSELQFKHDGQPLTLARKAVSLLVWPGWELAPVIGLGQGKMDTTPYLDEEVRVSVDTPQNQRPRSAGTLTCTGGMTTTPRSLVKFNLPPSAAYVTGTVGLDPLRGANGNTSVAVRSGDQDLFAMEELTSAVGAVRFASPLNGGPSLQFFTDFGAHAEYDDVVNWCELTVVKKLD